MATAAPASHPIRDWWHGRVVADVAHVEVNERVHDEAGWSPRYLFMITMSAGIAVLGLLLSSPAVVIGAMLISPLMGPIIGLGFALATVDARYIRRSAGALAAGSVIAILFCALIVLASPLQNVTSEIAARTRPNLFDLLVALFSALAGTYATIKGRAGTIVGVAIATALMPPLATVGFGLATWNWTVFGGAALLFVTNFVAIALTAAVMARLYGFASGLSPNQTRLQTLLIVATFVGLAVPLGLSLRQIAWENLAGRQARAAVASAFPENVRISQIELDYHSDPIAVAATVLTPDYRADANRAAAAEFRRLVGRPATMRIEQYRVGTAEADATALQTAQTQGSVAAADTIADNLSSGLALVAGVARGEVLVDDEKRRAFVRARALPGAGLSAYRALEVRLAHAADGWSVDLVPPAVPLGEVRMVDDEFDAVAVADAAWAARRRDEAIEVSGPAGPSAAVVRALAAAGARAISGPARPGAVRMTWSVPPPEAPPSTPVPAQ